MNIKEKLYEIIFEAETPAGKTFDVILIWSILLSVIVVIFDSVGSVSQKIGNILISIEWTLTIIFAVEYILRVYCSRKRAGYIFSFFGIVDLLTLVPTFLSVFLPNIHFLAVIRILRLLRIFRVLKLMRYLEGADILSNALVESRHKIVVFLLTVLLIVTVVGSLMYVIEGPEHGYINIPHSIYWAIVTLTTVGYGDIAPQTELGQLLSCFVMITGYGIVAVPTGIVSAKIATSYQRHAMAQIICPECKNNTNEANANFCSQCGAKF